jgi:hypothetical protein
MSDCSCAPLQTEFGVGHPFPCALAIAHGASKATQAWCVARDGIGYMAFYCPLTQTYGGKVYGPHHRSGCACNTPHHDQQSDTCADGTPAPRLQ